MRDVLIYRHKVTDNYSLGVCYIIMEDNSLLFIGVTLERGWRDNESNVSCVPEGTYNLALEYSDKFKKDLWELKGVPGRAECKFHAANYWRQLNGCISLGRQFVDIDKDGDLDITSSGDTLASFHKEMIGVSSKVTIKNIT
jgi:hypothetical protein